MLPANHRLDGLAIIVTRPMSKLEERHEFATAAEAESRFRFVTEAMSWIGTPFVDQGAVKGPKGCVDCAMMLARSAIDSGLVPEFEPRPYDSRCMMQKEGPELFVEIVERLGGREIDAGAFRVGDVILYRVAWKFSHGGVKATSTELVHADGVARKCLLSRLDEPILNFHPTREPIPREAKYFSMW